MGAVLPIQTNYDFWTTRKQDRVFHTLFLILLGIFLIFSIVIYAYQVPPKAILEVKKPIPSITKIQLKKEPVVMPPAPKPEPPAPKPEPPAPKPEPPAPKPEPPAPKPEPPAPKPEPPTLSPTQQREAARAKVQTRGLAAVDMSGLTALAETKPQASASKVIAATGNSNQSRERLYAASANQATANLTGTASSTDLDARLEQAKTSGASTNAGGSDAVLASESAGGSGSGATTRANQRDEASVRRVFEESKSSASALYNRALRANPTMSGRVSFEVVIAPSGQVTSARITDSQLQDPELERKLLLKVRSLQFGARNVAILKLTYSYDFLPS